MLLPLVCVALLASCTPERTEILVVVDTDLMAPTAIDEVRLTVARGGEAPRVAQKSLRFTDDLPVTLGLVHRDGPLGPVEIVASGHLEGSALGLERVARLDFRREATVVLRLDLLARCQDVVCGLGETCGPHGCRSIDLAPDEVRRYPNDLGRLDGSVVADGAGMDGSADPDAAVAVDGGPSMDGGPVVDGGPIADSGTAMACDPACTCPGGDTCSLACATATSCMVSCQGGTDCTVDGADNQALVMQCGRRASCAVDARRTVGAEVVCDNQSSCEVDCSDSTGCSVDCGSPNATCLLRCVGADTTCDISACRAGAPTACADDVLVCGRACP